MPQEEVKIAPGGLRADATDDGIRYVQGQVDETVVLMRDNIEKTIERGDKLEDLQDRTDDLEIQANQFSKTSTKLKKKYWWKNKKWTLIIVGVVFAVILIVVLSVVFAIKPWENKGDSGSGGNVPATPATVPP